MKSWSALCQWLAVDMKGADAPLLSLTADSRQAKVGSIFLALPGVSQHGVHFAMQAKQAGAWVVSDQVHEAADLVVPDLSSRLGALLNWFYGAPSQQLRIIGVTGTNGKTSVSHYVAQWLSMLGHSVAVLGTAGNGLWGQLTASSHTTLDAVRLHQQLAQWRDEGVEYVVMEVSSHAIDQQRIAGIEFTVLALTQVTRDHLDYHPSIEHYQQTKAALFRHWSSQYQVLNRQDALGQMLIDECTQVIGYAVDDEGDCASTDWCATELSYSPNGLSLALMHRQQQVWQGQLGVFGRFNVENVLCALACVQALIADFSLLSPLLADIRPVAGRMQQVVQQPAVFVDYAHTPDALAQVVRALQMHLQQGRLWLVFGAGGERDVGKRALMGEVANQYADVVYVTDDNPRHESPADIAAAILQSLNKDKATYIADRAAAICRAVMTAKPEDIVLIAGKGHEDYQEINGVRYPFSDVQVVQLCQR